MSATITVERRGTTVVVCINRPAVRKAVDPKNAQALFEAFVEFDKDDSAAHGHAMDMILTGRAVGAQEARMMGLANTVVPKGTAIEEAVAIADQIATFPQVCMRNDRASAYDSTTASNPSTAPIGSSNQFGVVSARLRTSSAPAAKLTCSASARESAVDRISPAAMPRSTAATNASSIIRCPCVSTARTFG